MSKVPNVGRQVNVFEEPDTIYMKLHGHVTEEEGLEIDTQHTRYAKGRAHIFYLIDMTDLESIPPSVRRAASAALKNLPARGMSIFGARLPSKVFVKLIVAGMNLFQEDSKKVPVNFSNSEEEARGWIAARRREIGAPAQVPVNVASPLEVG